MRFTYLLQLLPTRLQWEVCRLHSPAARMNNQPGIPVCDQATTMAPPSPVLRVPGAHAGPYKTPVHLSLAGVDGDPLPDCCLTVADIPAQYWQAEQHLLLAFHNSCHSKPLNVFPVHRNVTEWEGTWQLFPATSVFTVG